MEEAQAQFSDVVRIRPDFAPVHLSEGFTLAKSGDLEGALKEFQTTLHLDPTNPVARQNLDTIQANIQALKNHSP
ncbi:MAG TPA: hypothetical protein VNU95_14555 [Candidatus Acidoferrales bacterium]|nr:hypothetical protein [Candidatus Acidoferrales bacterium]